MATPIVESNSLPQITAYKAKTTKPQQSLQTQNGAENPPSSQLRLQTSHACTNPPCLHRSNLDPHQICHTCSVIPDSHHTFLKPYRSKLQPRSIPPPHTCLPAALAHIRPATHHHHPHDLRLLLLQPNHHHCCLFLLLLLIFLAAKLHLLCLVDLTIAEI
ncbi:uncharacterized protein [Malus domestica]|uniref:uncharacterized protein isoform X1 n=1 Tax=Malus domestica TaxID=3750 RepID=UPI003974AD82